MSTGRDVVKGGVGEKLTTLAVLLCPSVPCSTALCWLVKGARLGSAVMKRRPVAWSRCYVRLQFDPDFRTHCSPVCVRAPRQDPTNIRVHPLVLLGLTYSEKSAGDEQKVMNRGWQRAQFQLCTYAGLLAVRTPLIVAQQLSRGTRRCTRPSRLWLRPWIHDSAEWTNRRAHEEQE